MHGSATGSDAAAVAAAAAAGDSAGAAWRPESLPWARWAWAVRPWIQACQAGERAHNTKNAGCQAHLRALHAQHACLGMHVLFIYLFIIYKHMHTDTVCAAH